ncbi:MAG: glycosyl transferase group 1 [Bacteroidetes bacterium]|nr:glycosyl transferase group 1 [Bacteroidota bacterium]
MQDAKKKKICLFTTGYPYGNKVETFIDSETGVMSEMFEKIYIFPAISNDPHVRNIPANAEIIRLDQAWEKHSSRILSSNFFLIAQILFSEFVTAPSKKYFLDNVRKFKNTLVHKLYLAEQLEAIIKREKLEDAVFYSYWLNDWTIMLGMLKRKGVVRSFISRVHGFDLYEDRWPQGIIPFRNFQLKMVDRVFSVSKKGYNYLKNRKLFPEKIAYSYLGVPDHGLNPFDEHAPFKIVSCSNLMPLKRVHLIVEILRNIDIPVSWVHFGDGKLFEEVKTLASTLPSNVSVEFKGHVSNSEVLEYYGSHSINLFIIASEMEGLPMSLIEACSFGIPLMGTDVDGIPEIVNDTTGILIPKEVDPVKAAALIRDFREKKNTKAFRAGVREFWKENFYNRNNYQAFYNTIIDISKGKR